MKSNVQRYCAAPANCFAERWRLGRCWWDGAAVRRTKRKLSKGKRRLQQICRIWTTGRGRDLAWGNEKTLQIVFVSRVMNQMLNTFRVLTFSLFTQLSYLRHWLTHNRRKRTCVHAGKFSFGTICMWQVQNSCIWMWRFVLFFIF